MGKLWSDSLSFSQFGIQILKCVVFSILGCALIIPVHEFIHWIAYKKEGANDVRFGAIWKSFVFYAAAYNFAADYKTFRRIALAPFYILSVLLVLLFLFPVPLWGKISIAAILLFHIISCSGDLSMLSYMKRYKRRNVITVDDIDNRFTYFIGKINYEFNDSIFNSRCYLLIVIFYVIHKIFKIVRNLQGANFCLLRV